MTYTFRHSSNLEREPRKMGRSPCCSKVGLNKGTWTALEDRILTSYIKAHGEGNWRSLPKRAGLKRCGKSCRLRWMNYLRPDIKRGNISEDEEELIIRLHKLLGNRWSLIAGRLPGRTDNEIKNYWNTILKKRANSSHASPLPPYQESLPNKSSVRQVTLAQNQSRPSCEFSNRPSATVTRPRVFRAKPAWCSSPMYPFPCHNNQVVMNTSSQYFDITIDDHQCHQIEDKYAYEMSFFNFGTNHSQGSLNNENNIDGKGYSVHENTNKVSLVIDEQPTVENWGLHTYCDVVEVEEKDPLDLDPLALFLRADEWP